MARDTPRRAGARGAAVAHFSRSVVGRWVFNAGLGLSALGLCGVLMAPAVMAQTTAPKEPATSAAPVACRAARAMHDTSCPNYTGLPADSKAAFSLSGEGAPGLRMNGLAPGLSDLAGTPGLKKGRVIDHGRASWYGERHHGARTASGEAFSKDDYTAAHNTLPFGTRVLVHNARTGQEVVVRITDRGPHTRGRVIDVSKSAAKKLGMIASGHDDVTIHALVPSGASAADAPAAKAAAAAGGAEQ